MFQPVCPVKNTTKQNPLHLKALIKFPSLTSVYHVIFVIFNLLHSIKRFFFITLTLQNVYTVVSHDNQIREINNISPDKRNKQYIICTKELYFH